MTYHGIAFEGGGVLGIAHAGVCSYLGEIGLSKELKYFAGSSAGAFIAGLMACRVTEDQLKEILFGINFKEFEDDSWLIFFDIYRLINKFGWNRGEVIGKWFGDLLDKYIGERDITFQEVLDKYGSYLIITSTDFGYDEVIYYTPDSSPNMSIRDAVSESARYPIEFCPVFKNDNMYIDGGTKDNYPIKKLYDYLPKEEVFGVKLVSTTEAKRQKRPVKVLPKNLKEYLSILLEIIYNQALRVYVSKDDWQRSIPVNVGDLSTLDFNLTEENKNFLFQQGYDAAKKFFSEKIL